MEYTVNLLISKCGNTNDEEVKVLLQKKSKGVYKGKWNGVGGKVRKGEYPLIASLRKIAEDTGLHDIRNYRDIRYLGKLILPTDCTTERPEECILHFYSMIVDPILAPEAIHQKPADTEELEWVGIWKVIHRAPDEGVYAGDGDLQYFLNMARAVYGFE